MKPVEFKNANLRIGEGQPEYIPIPALGLPNEHGVPVVIGFELDEEEMEQVRSSHRIWLKILTFGNNFHPISTSCIKPEEVEE